MLKREVFYNKFRTRCSIRKQSFECVENLGKSCEVIICCAIHLVVAPKPINSEFSQ